jgi:phage protein D
MGERVALFYYVALVNTDDDTDVVDLTRRVEGFEAIDREAGMDRLKLTVDNRDLANFDDPVFEQGAKLRVSWGNGRSSAPLRDMVVKKVTGGRTLTVSCVSKAGAVLDTVKKRRCFFAVTRSDVVRQLAQENGFVEPDVEDTEEVFTELSQGNLSDGQLARKLAELEGFEFYIDWQGFHWHRRRVGQAPVRDYRYFIDEQGGDIIDFDVTNDVTRRPGRVTVKSRDPLAKTDIEANASNSEDKDRDVLQENTGTIDGESGALTLQPEIVHEQTVASNVETQQDAEREAKGKYRKAAQGVVKMTLQMRGDPSLVAKTVIKLNGFGKRLSGKYYVKEVTHSLSAAGGYSMSVKVITDGFQRKGKGKGAGDGDEATAILSSLGEQLEAALGEDFATDVAGETGALLTSPDQIGGVTAMGKLLVQELAEVSKLQGDDLRKGAVTTGRRALRLASAARTAKMPNTAASAKEIASTLIRIAEGPAEVKAQGKLNTQDVSTSDVTAVDSVDSEGNPVTTYVNTGGRQG